MIFISSDTNVWIDFMTIGNWNCLSVCHTLI